MIRPQFLDAATVASALVAAHEVAARWEEPSALAEFTVRGLAGHLVRATTSVEAYLDRPEPGGEPITPAEYYAAAVGEGPPDLGSPLHRAIRDRGEEAAAQGHAALVASFEAAIDRLHLRLVDERPDRRVQVFGDMVLTLDDYLVTRLIELVVHTDDLAVSVGVPTPEPAPGSAVPAIDTLVAVARLRHGDLAVLRALTRRERDPLDALHVL
jgi:uncharacterized protein (TIGR03083 family)